MNSITNQQQIANLLTNLHETIIEMLPDDDFFWENNRDMVEEAMEYINQIRQLNAR